MRLKTIFNTPINRKSPTPPPTVKISALPFITLATCFASTERSGSATVMSTPIAKQTGKSSFNFLDLVRPVPICSPIGVMARSAPRLKSAIPIIKRTADTTKTTNSVLVKSTSGVK